MYIYFLQDSVAVLTEDACEDLQSMFANHVVNPCAMARSLPDAGPIGSGDKASPAGLSSTSISRPPALGVATSVRASSSRESNSRHAASSLDAVVRPHGHDSSSARVFCRAERRFGKARADASDPKLSSSSAHLFDYSLPLLNSSDRPLKLGDAEQKGFALRNKSRRTPITSLSIAKFKKSSLPTLENLRNSHQHQSAHAAAHSRTPNGSTSSPDERTCSPVPSAVVAHFPTASATSNASMSMSSVTQYFQQKQHEAVLNALPSDAASAGSGSGSAQSTHSLLHQINLRNLQNAISAISQAVSANGGSALARHSLPAATDADPIQLIDAVAHALNALDSAQKQNLKPLVANDLLPLAAATSKDAKAAACASITQQLSPTDHNAPVPAVSQNQQVVGTTTSRTSQASRHSALPSISRPELCSANSGEHKERAASSGSNAIRSILSVTRTDWLVLILHMYSVQYSTVHY